MGPPGYHGRGRGRPGPNFLPGTMSIPGTLKNRLLPVLTSAVALLAGCGGDAAAPADATAIDRETFIAAYVDLRTAAVRSESPEIPDGERAAVLARHGVTEEDLLGFAEAHGRDVAFMREVWDEVEARLDAQRVLPGSDERR